MCATITIFMGNCQAVDNASLLIQHPGGRRVDKHYSPLSAAQIMNSNPGHCVALLLTTTTSTSNHIPLRITRIKLLKPTDTLLLGHVYRLITNQEVMKGLWAKKHSKLQSSPGQERNEQKYYSTSDSNTGFGRSDQLYKYQVKHERQRPRNSSAGRCKAWQPSLLSISEAAGS